MDAISQNPANVSANSIHSIFDQEIAENTKYSNGYGYMQYVGCNTVDLYSLYLPPNCSSTGIMLKFTYQGQMGYCSVILSRQSRQISRQINLANWHLISLLSRDSKVMASFLSNAIQ